MKDENKEKKSGLWSILGLVVLIALLFAGVKLTFAGLEAAIPQDDISSSAGQSAEAGGAQSQEEPDGLPAPAFCPFCGEELNEAFQWGQYCPFCGELVER